MSSNLQTTSDDEDLQLGAEAPGNISAATGPAPQSRQRQRRTAPSSRAPGAITPAANAASAIRPVSEPAVAAASGSSTQPQRMARTPANFDPSSSREALIATAAYYRAHERGFQPGHELQDWLAAEREIDGAGFDPT
jgi:hypothetical protein